MRNRLRLMFVLDYFKGLLLARYVSTFNSHSILRADQIAAADIKTFLYSDRLFIA
ncbi:hypothetical protein [Peribacillus frigoritolerans]|uniref:hypothetical protein n=1 Tax=Peribacillus frigoritolerans TaxID=450367 RepID=UPI002E1EE4E6|nr:hypothetical protein [Peribacillus frigoritolerans]